MHKVDKKQIKTLTAPSHSVKIIEDMSENIKVVLMLLSVTTLIFLASLAFADGDVKRGKTLFNDPKLSGSSFGVSCNTCHPNGKGLEYAWSVGKTTWSSCSGERKSLEASVNTCILMANKGQPLDLNSQEMKNLIAYIKLLAKKTKKKLPKVEK
jgi:cytochrome c peroxidase